MKITIIGRGNVGGALQSVLSVNGHDVDALGRDGGLEDYVDWPDAG